MIAKTMNSLPATRYTLIEKIRNPQDVEAWHEFTAIYQPLIFNVCRKRGLQHADATDVTQEVLARVANAVDEFRHDRAGATFRGWLYRITRNLTADYFRRRGKDPLAKATLHTELPDDWQPTEEESGEFQLEFRKQMFSIVTTIVQSQVKPATWQAFWQTEVLGESVDLVAKELSLSTGAIYVARSRVLARLRKEVQRRLDEANLHFDVKPDGNEA
jgi:RNA polymerase sigma-70 factor (ECF subfamily)